MRAGGARPSRRRQVAGGGGGSPPGMVADPERGARPGRRRRNPLGCGGSHQIRGATGGGGSPREARETEPHGRCRGGRRVDGAADAGSRREAWRERRRVGAEVLHGIRRRRVEGATRSPCCHHGSTRWVTGAARRL
ncbi:hypothetical protein PVAP13_5NG425440 [Panicum virgatum]|uniref:Uncharacterized protein n=1 Tax=Panicum virgatum TaxID=38727 RepID=A0A8T0S290_PANVG|nr:hypothetical protein PVAP13_5NG425440 [Panicum virgatum]